MTYWLGKGIAPAVFNFSKYASSEHLKGIITTVDIQKAITKNLHSSTKIVSMKPERLEFYFNYGQRKEVPVRLAGNMDPAGSYYLASTHVEPSTVAVYASQKLLDSLNSVTAILNITNYEDTVVQTVPLTKRTGMKCVPAEVKVTLCPDILTEQTIEVPVTAVGMPADKILRTFPAKVEVSFNVGASVFRFIHPEQFTVQADYNDIVANPSEKCTTAITGGIGSGKSYVASLLRKRGIEVYDCDAAAKQIMRQSGDIQNALAELIGKPVIVDGQLNKRAIAEFLLESERNKQAINDIVHPAVARDFEQSGLTWIESAILFESSFNSRTHIDRVVCVVAPKRVRVKRIVERDHITASQARQWIDSQTPQQIIARQSDYVIVNDGVQDIEQQLEQLL